MALTIAASPSNFLSVSENPMSLGVRRVWVGVLAADNSYPTGGYKMDPFLVGLNEIGQILASPALVAGATPVYWVWNTTTRKLQAFAPAGTEIAGSTDLSAQTIAVLILAH